MKKFDHIFNKITKRAELTAVPSEHVVQLRKEYPAVPEEYFEFLREVGWGNIGGLMMYRDLLDPNGFIAPVEEPWENVAVFGDDWQAAHFGFDLKTGELLEITPEGYVETVGSDFMSFIADYSS